VVKRIYTNLAVIDVTPEGLVVREMVPAMDLVRLQTLTEPKLTLAADCLEIHAPAISGPSKAKASEQAA